MNSEEKKEIILKSVIDLPITYPEKPQALTDKEYCSNISNLKNNVCITPKNEVAVKKQGIAKILSTDKKGANKFMNDLPNTERVENGNDSYAKLSSVQKELTKRIQEPRDVVTKEKLKFSEKALISIRDYPELEKNRCIDYQRTQNALPKLKEKKIKMENISTDDITGEPLKPDAVAHHIERKADDPNQALDLNNITILNCGTHTEGHKNNFEGKENYEKFKKDKQEKR